MDGLSDFDVLFVFDVLVANTGRRLWAICAHVAPRGPPDTAAVVGKVLSKLVVTRLEPLVTTKHFLF